MALFLEESPATLFPFFLGMFFYFYFPTRDLSFLPKVSLKCFPIMALIGFLYFRKVKTPDEDNSRKIIMIGLIFSCIGDAFLLVQNLFIPGMIAFALAHFMYIRAHGFQLVEIKYGLVLYGICIIMLYILMPGLTGPLVYAVPVYGFMLVTMTWCSLTVMNRCKTDSYWLAMITGIGGLLWMSSDAILSYNKFINKVPYEEVLIMITYYLGQLGVTMSSFICWKSYDSSVETRKKL